MPKFEVHIPAADAHSLNVTLRVDAEHWMAALKTGLHKLGAQGASVQNVLVDIQDDNSVHITETQSGRVFRIRELSGEEAASAPVKKTAEPIPGIEDARKRTSSWPWLESLTPQGQLEGGPDKAEAKTRVIPREPEPPRIPAPRQPSPPVPPARAPFPSIPSSRGSSPRDLLPRDYPPPAAPRPESLPRVPLRESSPLQPQSVVELEHPTRPVLGQIGRAVGERKDQKSDVEDALSDVFERVQEVYNQPSEDAAFYFLLDLALEKIATESGSVLLADAGTGDLSFAAVRGPKAQELLSAAVIIPAGVGIVGFCASEGVSLALSEVQKDPRYYSEVSERLKYPTKSVLCSPMMTHGRAFGCMQLVNKKGADVFGEHEIGILSYIAHQAALYLNRRN